MHTIYFGTHQGRPDLNDWSRQNSIPGPPYTNLTVIEFEGEYWGFSEVTDDTYTDRLRAQVVRYGLDQLTEAWFGWKFYVPSEFTVPTTGFCNIGSLHQRTIGSFYSLHIRREGTLQIRTGLETPWGSGVIQSGDDRIRKSNIPLPRDRPFNVMVHLRALIDGILEVWIDGRKELTYPRDMRSSMGNVEPGPTMRAGLGQAANAGVHWMLFKDCVCASTMEEVEDWLGPTPRPLMPTALEAIFIGLGVTLIGI